MYLIKIRYIVNELILLKLTCKVSFEYYNLLLFLFIYLIFTLSFNIYFEKNIYPLIVH